LSSEIFVRRLTPADAALYREIRLEALATNPEAFSSTFAAENAQPLPWFADRLRNSAVFAAFDGPQAVGIAAFFVRPGDARQGEGVLVGMYVRPDARRAGIGRCLVAAVIEQSSLQVNSLHLTVMGGNAPARRLYLGAGFAECGRAGDEVMMAKTLPPIDNIAIKC
jgi:GNAT superfamily N-acetyltransferase